MPGLWVSGVWILKGSQRRKKIGNLEQDRCLLDRKAIYALLLLRLNGIMVFDTDAK